MKLVSVIIPCHNRIHLLLECLDSISQQTYPAIEILVVDDASDEDVSSAVAHFKQQVKLEVEYIRSHINVGPGQARELGRLKATGDYICYQDSDDLWHPTKIQAQVECFEQNPIIGMCYCTSKKFDTWPLTGNEPLRKHSDHSFTKFLPMLLELKDRPWGTGACMWAHWATEKIGPWLPGWSWEDMEYECRAGCHNIAIKHINKELCYYRTGDSSGKLSQENQKKITIQRVAPIIAIGHHLEKHHLTSNRQISSAYGWMVYDHAISLLKFHEINASTKLLQPLTKYGIYSFQIKKTAQFTLFLIKTIRNPILIWLYGRIMKYCRINIIKPSFQDNS